MPYFVDATGQVIVTISGAKAPPNVSEIPAAAAKHAHLKHGDHLPTAAQEAVGVRDWDAFAAAYPQYAPPPDAPTVSPTSENQLPQLGRWEYRVMAITELAGFATAKGTASRMEAALNKLGAEGWELSTATDRASRWMAGESVVLTFRRFITTERDFELRVRAEELLRRKVIDELPSPTEESEPERGRAREHLNPGVAYRPRPAGDLLRLK